MTTPMTVPAGRLPRHPRLDARDILRPRLEHRGAAMPEMNKLDIAALKKA